MEQTLKMRLKCSRCKGTQKVTCSTCGGLGHKTNDPIYKWKNGYQRTEDICGSCNGEGHRDCPKCNARKNKKS